MSLYNDQFSISLQNATLILPCSEKLNPQRNKKIWKKKTQHWPARQRYTTYAQFQR